MRNLIFIVLTLLATGCVSPTAISALKVGQSANKGHMGDAGLPPEAKLIAQDNYDLMGEVLYNLDGTGMPADTQERYDARKAKKAAAAEEGGDE